MEQVKSPIPIPPAVNCVKAEHKLVVPVTYAIAQTTKAKKIRTIPGVKTDDQLNTTEDAFMQHKEDESDTDHYPASSPVVDNQIQHVCYKPDVDRQVLPLPIHSEGSTSYVICANTKSEIVYVSVDKDITMKSNEQCNNPDTESMGMGDKDYIEARGNNKDLERCVFRNMNMPLSTGNFSSVENTVQKDVFITNHSYIAADKMSNSCLIETCTDASNNTGQEITISPVSSTKEVICSIFGKELLPKTRLQQHLKMHEDTKQFPCDQCDKTFLFRTSLRQHMHTHRIESKFSCMTCAKMFTSHKVFKKHLLIHPNEKHFVCCDCSKRFSFNRYLKQHMLTHAGEKNYVCQTCGEIFNSHKCLKKHLLIHPSERHFVCDQCGKGFTFKRYLNQHMMTHAGNNSFNCETCGQLFKSHKCFKRHLLTHPSEKHFTCDQCGKGFTFKRYLMQHMNVHRKDKHKLIKFNNCKDNC